MDIRIPDLPHARAQKARDRAMLEQVALIIWIPEMEERIKDVEELLAICPEPEGWEARALAIGSLESMKLRLKQIEAEFNLFFN